MKHVMCDLETMGTIASAVILSIGAVRFDLDTTVGFTRPSLSRATLTLVGVFRKTHCSGG